MACTQSTTRSQRLISRELVTRLDRRPGQKEERYEHLLSADFDESNRVAMPISSTPIPTFTPSTIDPAHPVSEPTVAPVVALEGRVAKLEREVAALRAVLGERGIEGQPTGEASMSVPLAQSAEPDSDREAASVQSASSFQP